MALICRRAEDVACTEGGASFGIGVAVPLLSLVNVIKYKALTGVSKNEILIKT